MSLSPAQQKERLEKAHARALALHEIISNPERLSHIKDRFRKYIKVDDKGCWLWTGSIDKKGRATGYGRFQMATRRSILAHCAAYLLFKGPIPTGRVIDHKCQTRACVNPKHLKAVTQRVNVLRGTGPSAANAKKTHCPEGHPYDRTNTVWDGSKYGRKCRICQNEQSKLRNRRYRAEARKRGETLPTDQKRRRS